MMLIKSLLSATALLQVAAAAYSNMAYYAHEMKYLPTPHNVQDLKADQLTHLYYAFLKVNTNGTVEATDVYGDYQLIYPGDNQFEVGTNVYGSVKQMYLMKQKNRKLKTIASIGGAGHDAAFLSAIKTAANRKRFIDSSIQIMLDWGMDGLDLDYEFPKSNQEGEWFYTLAKDLRAAMDAKSAALGQNYHYLLTAALPAGADYYKFFPLGKFNARLDFFNLMAYDFAGSFYPYSAHNSALYIDKSNPLGTPTRADDAVNAYIKAGVSPNKIALGIPLSGRVFTNTAGLGKTYKTVTSVPFNTIPRKGATVYERPDQGALVTYDKNKKELVSLDGGASVKRKVTYLKNKGLAGTFFWETSGDKTGSSSLLAIAKSALSSLDSTNNQLLYPTSKWDNIRLQMQPQTAASKRTLRWGARAEQSE